MAKAKKRKLSITGAAKQDIYEEMMLEQKSPHYHASAFEHRVYAFRYGYKFQERHITLEEITTAFTMQWMPERGKDGPFTSDLKQLLMAVLQHGMRLAKKKGFPELSQHAMDCPRCERQATLDCPAFRMILLNAFTLDTEWRFVKEKK